MAWARVQSASTTNTSGTATSAAVAYGTNLSSGTTLLAAVAVSASGTPTTSGVSDGTNSFALVKAQAGGTIENTSLWILNTPAGDVGTKPTITATTTGSGGPISLLIMEVSGLTGAVDGTPGGKAGSGTGTTGSPTYSSSASNEMLVAVYGDDGGPITFTAPYGATSANLDPNSVNSNSDADIAIAYTNSTGTTETGSWTLTGTSAEWAVILVALDVSGPSITSGPPLAPGLPSSVAVIGGRSGWQGASHSR